MKTLQKVFTMTLLSQLMEGIGSSSIHIITGSNLWKIWARGQWPYLISHYQKEEFGLVSNKDSLDQTLNKLSNCKCSNGTSSI